MSRCSIRPDNVLNRLRFDHISEQVGDPQFVFEAKSVQRMELLVLNKLKWRLRAITPCSYIRYFLRKMSKCDQEPSNTLISRSLQVIASTTKGEKKSLSFMFYFLDHFCFCAFLGFVVFFTFAFYDFGLKWWLCRVSRYWLFGV